MDLYLSFIQTEVKAKRKSYVRDKDMNPYLSLCLQPPVKKDTFSFLLKLITYIWKSQVEWAEPTPG